MIHQYKSNGYNIVMDVNSGSVHVVDDIVYDMIPLVEPLVTEGIKDADTIKAAVLNLANIPYPQEEITEAVDEVLELEKAGQLFAPDIYENYIFDFKKRQTVVKALCLHIAHDCNLACRYCFAEEGEYHGRRALMSFEVGKKGTGFPGSQFRQPCEPGSGFLRRRTTDELGCGKAAGRIRQKLREVQQ